MNLTLVRHGATAWNASRRFQGHTDLPLSEAGVAQARELAARLSDERVDAVYSSDLRRAMETARAIADVHGIEVRGDVRLREFAFGAWEGLTWAEIVSTRPHLDEKVWKNARLYAPEGGETYDAVWTRVRAFYRDVVASGIERIVVVTHAGVMHALLDVAEIENEPGLAFSPASVVRLAIEDGRARVLAP